MTNALPPGCIPCDFCEANGEIPSHVSVAATMVKCSDCAGKGYQDIVERLQVEFEWRNAPQLADEDEARSAALMKDAIAEFKRLRDCISETPFRNVCCQEYETCTKTGCVNLIGRLRADRDEAREIASWWHKLGEDIIGERFHPTDMVLKLAEEKWREKEAYAELTTRKAWKVLDTCAILDCACSLRERESGHRVGCAVPYQHAALDELRAVLRRDGEASTVTGAIIDEPGLDEKIAQAFPQGCHEIVRPQNPDAPVPTPKSDDGLSPAGGSPSHARNGADGEPVALGPDGCHAVGIPQPRKVWLWRNFVDGRPEYWAFDNPFPVNLDNGDPQTLGEPCGYALVKPSRNGRPEVGEAEVLDGIKRVLAKEGHSQYSPPDPLPPESPLWKTMNAKPPMPNTRVRVAFEDESQGTALWTGTAWAEVLPSAGMAFIAWAPLPQSSHAQDSRK